MSQTGTENFKSEDPQIDLQSEIEQAIKLVALLGMEWYDVIGQW